MVVKFVFIVDDSAIRNCVQPQLPDVALAESLCFDII